MTRPEGTAEQIIDSTPMLGAAATQDTVRLVRHGVRKLIDAVAAVDGNAAGRLDDGLEFDYARPGEKPDCRWREKAERERMLTRVAQDAERGLRAVEQADGLLGDETVEAAHGLLRELIGQDFDIDDGGVPRLHRGTRSTVKRGGQHSLGGALSDAADYGYCTSHSRHFWGMRLHLLCSPDGTPRAIELTSPKANERDIALKMLQRVNRNGRLTLIGDKGYAGRDFKAQTAALNIDLQRPRRKDEPGRGPHLAPIRQRIESIFGTAKDLLTLERHGARTLHGLRARIASRFLALAAAITLNYQLGRPPRALADYTA